MSVKGNFTQNSILSSVLPNKIIKIKRGSEISDKNGIISKFHLQYDNAFRNVVRACPNSKFSQNIYRKVRSKHS